MLCYALYSDPTFAAAVLPSPYIGSRYPDVAKVPRTPSNLVGGSMRQKPAENSPKSPLLCPTQIQITKPAEPDLSLAPISRHHVPCAFRVPQQRSQIDHLCGWSSPSLACSVLQVAADGNGRSVGLPVCSRPKLPSFSCPDYRCCGWRAMLLCASFQIFSSNRKPVVET